MLKLKVVLLSVSLFCIASIASAQTPIPMTVRVPEFDFAGAAQQMMQAFSKIFLITIGLGLSIWVIPYCYRLYTSLALKIEDSERRNSKDYVDPTSLEGRLSREYSERRLLMKKYGITRDEYSVMKKSVDDEREYGDLIDKHYIRVGDDLVEKDD